MYLKAHFIPKQSNGVIKNGWDWQTVVLLISGRDNQETNSIKQQSQPGVRLPLVLGEKYAKVEF